MALSLSALSLEEKGMLSTLAAADEMDALPAISMDALPDEILQHIFSQLFNVLEPRLALYLGSASSELRVLLTPALRQRLRADHEVAAALCRKAGMRSCRELREARSVNWHEKGLTATDLVTLSTLGSVLPALESLTIFEFAPDLTAGSAPAPSPSASRCTPSGPAAPELSMRSSDSRAGSTEPSVLSVARSAAASPLLSHSSFVASRSSLQPRIPTLRHNAAATS